MNDVSQSTVILRPATAGQPFDFDVTIVGAGPVGLALAGWLARRSATRALKIALVDAREPEDSIADPRAIAVSHGSRMILEPLRWPADATAIQRIHVSQRGHFGRTLIDHGEHGLPALGYVLRYGSIVHGLAEAVHATSVHWFRSTSAAAPTQERDGVTLPIETAGVTRHAAHAHSRERRRRPVRRSERPPEASGRRANDSAAETGTRDYGQTALVGTVTVSAPQPHVAWERFTSQGPIALLPMGGVRGSRLRAGLVLRARGSRAPRATLRRSTSCANSAPRSASAWAASRTSRGARRSRWD